MPIDIMRRIRHSTRLQHQIDHYTRRRMRQALNSFPKGGSQGLAIGHFKQNGRMNGSNEIIGMPLPTICRLDVLYNSSFFMESGHTRMAVHLTAMLLKLTPQKLC